MKKRILAIALCSAIIMTAALYGCSGEGGATADEATTTAAAESSASEGTKVETAVATVNTEGNDKNPEENVQRETVAFPVDGWNGNPDSNGKFEVSGGPSEEETVCNLTVADTDYMAEVGDVITYQYYLKTPDLIEDFQAATYYDPAMLKLLDAKSQEMFPVSGKSTVYNADDKGTILYNAIDIEGMDFTKGAVMVSFKFEVLSNGYTSIGTSMEFLDGVGAVSLVNKYKIIGDISFSEELFV